MSTRDLALRALIVKRFQAKVDVGTTGCHLWTASISWDGYARFRYEGRMAYAHRVAYELFIAPIPYGLSIDHLCRVRHCVNPAHLEAVPIRENILRAPTARATIHSARTECVHGHKYTPENTFLYRGNRECLTCRRARGRAYYHAHKAAKAGGTS